MKIGLTYRNQRLFVSSPYSATLIGRFQAIPGREFHRDTKEWSFPVVRDVVLMVADAVGVLPMFLPPEVKAIIGPSGEEATNKICLPDLSGADGSFKDVRFGASLPTPYRHQRWTMAYLLANNRWLVADEMGLGKTYVLVRRLTAIADISASMLIVCPRSVRQTWVDQLKKYGHISEVADYVHVRRNYKTVLGCINIAHYEQLLLEDFTEVEWRTIVFDEIHRLKNFTAQTSRIARKLSEKATYVYGLSGTPAPNGVEDWFGVLSVIDPNMLPVKSKKDFEARYTIKERIKDTNQWKIAGYRNMQELHYYIGRVTSRFTKADCLDLPPKTIVPRLVELLGEQAQAYRDLRHDSVAMIKSLKASGQLTAKNILTAGLRLLQICGGFVQDDDGVEHEFDDNPKLEALLDIVSEAGDKQVIVWTAFLPEAKKVAQVLGKETDREVRLFTGDTTDRDRVKAVNDFKSGAATYFVGTAAAGGTGIDGLQVADTEVYYSRNFSLTDWLQSQDRAHRLGQTRPLTIYTLMARTTIDLKIDEALLRKHDLLEMMLGESPEQMF